MAGTYLWDWSKSKPRCKFESLDDLTLPRDRGFFIQDQGGTRFLTNHLNERRARKFTFTHDRVKVSCMTGSYNCISRSKTPTMRAWLVGLIRPTSKSPAVESTPGRRCAGHTFCESNSYGQCNFSALVSSKRLVLRKRYCVSGKSLASARSFRPRHTSNTQHHISCEWNVMRMSLEYVSPDDTQKLCSGAQRFCREHKFSHRNDLQFPYLWSKREKWKRPSGHFHFRVREQSKEHCISLLWYAVFLTGTKGVWWMPWLQEAMKDVIWLR